MRISAPHKPGPNEVHIEAVTKEAKGAEYHLRGMVLFETTEMQLKADEVDYNQDTGDLEARGHIHFEHFSRREIIDCDRVEYNIETETGKFYEIKGSTPSRIEVRPGLLTTQNPFYFQGKWAERLKDRYILHDGFLTDCIVPRPWWRLRAPSFDVIPGERAIAKNAWFYVGKVPIFYAPGFYKSLEKQPRRSGLLTPNIGNSSRRGKMVGVGYFWAINRSTDLTYRLQYFSERGLAHQADFRAKLNDKTDLDANIYAVADRGQNGGTSAGGYLATVNFKSDFGKGWIARGELNYLSSFAFRQQFTESFHEAIFSETHSAGSLGKHWNTYGLTVVAQRDVSFQSTAEGDQIQVRKLPEVEFLTREHAIANLPLWFSLDSSFGLVRRTQPQFQSRQFVERGSIAPRITGAFHFWGIGLLPSFGLHETGYGASKIGGKITGDDFLRGSRDFEVEMTLPSIERVFGNPNETRWKHVIEPRASYRYVTGLSDFKNVIRIDELDLQTNTNEAEFSLTNRLYSRDKNGSVGEVLSWQVWYKRYFDPTFGGSIVPGQRNVIESSAALTPYAFLNGYRNQSPIVSSVRLQSRIGLEWRTDYDPVRHGFVNSGLTADGRYKKVAVALGHNSVKADPILAPSANQFRGQVTLGNENRRGFNTGFSAYYDYRKGILQYSQTQVTYNTDCCGFSVQYRRFAIGARNENQFRVAFAISNIGSFGTLKRQERIF